MGLRTKLNPMGSEGITEKDFVRPDLTANGTMGGNSFAVEASSEFSSSRSAYMAVDSDTSTYWRASSTNDQYYYFYNPKPLKVSNIVITFSGSSYRVSKATIAGSNDNSTYTSITSSYSGTTTGTLTLTTSKFYKYYRLRLNTYNAAIRVTNIAITAKYKG